MNTIKIFDTITLLSALWIVVILSLLKANILSLFIPGTAEELAKTAATLALAYLS